MRLRQWYGQNRVQFVSDIRMEKGGERLCTSGMRIKDIVTANRSAATPHLLTAKMDPLRRFLSRLCYYSSHCLL